MPALRLTRSRFALALLTGTTSLALATHHAHADEYTDLLDILRLKGSLTKSEYDGLMTKHTRHMRADASAARHASPEPEEREARAQTASGSNTHSHHVLRSASHRTELAGNDSDAALFQAQDAARRAEASADAAQQALASARAEYHSPSIVRVSDYVPGKGITFHAGQIDLNFSGFVNGFYTFNNPGGGTPVAGGVANGASGFDSSAVRNGLLPAGMLIKVSTTQEGWDMSANFGLYPGINNNKPGAFNANSGGSAVGLGTAGLDVRQVFATFGRKDVGTFKVGRDLALFGGDAILNDATLLSVGSTGSNTAPANTSLGRIGVGYVYADWIPQISYMSPKWKGLQGTIGIFEPLDEFNFAGGGYSAGNTQHSSPMVQGKVTYDFNIGDVTARIWSSFLVQHQQALLGAGINPSAKRGQTAAAADIGTKVTYGPLEGVAYYYYGNGLGTTGLFFDGIAANGRKRDSEGYYVQMAYKILPKLKLVGSYGQSNLYQAPGEITPLLVRRNESEVGAAYYNLTDWLTLMAEYAHTTSLAHGPDHNKDNTISVGAAIFF
ncbi:porin family protein [Brytella acorum]|uniref:Porin n=1 Tax=Brytella acorum TaxID=2959299 RepID=A0AA35Y2M5_9PROT|nr:porin [Brytella acorum]MDF3623576.1 porin [Brytella acorum]CAI9120006.1 porin [Brytella acorum]